MSTSFQFFTQEDNFVQAYCNNIEGFQFQVWVYLSIIYLTVSSTLKKSSKNYTCFILRRFGLSIFSQKIKQHLAMLAIENQKTLRRKKYNLLICLFGSESDTQFISNYRGSQKTTLLQKLRHSASQGRCWLFHAVNIEEEQAQKQRASIYIRTSSQSRGHEPICYRGPLCQLPLSNRAAHLFSHTMKPVSSILLVRLNAKVQDSWSRLNASQAARNSFAGRMFVTPVTEKRQILQCSRRKMEICKQRQTDEANGKKVGQKCASLNKSIQIISNGGIKYLDEFKPYYTRFLAGVCFWF